MPTPYAPRVAELAAEALARLCPGSSLRIGEPLPDCEDDSLLVLGAIALIPYADGAGRTLAAQAHLELWEAPAEVDRLGSPAALRAKLHGRPLSGTPAALPTEEGLRTIAEAIALEVAAWAGRQISPDCATDAELESAARRGGREALASRILSGCSYSSRFAAATGWARRHAPADHPVLRRERISARLSTEGDRPPLAERAREVARLCLEAEAPEDGGPGLAAAEAALDLADLLAA